MSLLRTHPISTALGTSELDYDLPQRLIATRPAEPRDSARLLVMSRSNETLEHAYVRDLPRFLRRGDALIFNTTAVAPARLVGEREKTGGKVEGLYLHDEPSTNGTLRWRVMLHAGGKLHRGDRILLAAELGAATCVIELIEKASGEWIVLVHNEASTPQILESVGRTPLPPYILKARGSQSFADGQDRAWYQTIYAAQKEKKSVAAPTAGLHFTPELLNQLSANGVERIDITLHVGAGTFKPVTADTLAAHRMHSEEFEVSAGAIASLMRAKLRIDCRLLAVGTTSVRTLESLPWPELNESIIRDGVRGSTDLLIAPPYDFKCVDGMLTNFHLPRSTLLALVAAMVGLDRLKAVYRIAIEGGYRFYSYGDAMLILP